MFVTIVNRTFKMAAKIMLIACVIMYVVECENSMQLPPGFPGRHLQPLNALVGLGGGKKECVHSNVTFGKRISGDLQTFVEVVKAEKHMFRKTNTQVNYPSGSTKNKCNITFINVENLFQGCKCFHEAINVVDGGVGFSYMKLNLTSETNCPNHHKISCFTKC